MYMQATLTEQVLACWICFASSSPSLTVNCTSTSFVISHQDFGALVDKHLSLFNNCVECCDSMKAQLKITSV